jgi:hypothetical protein
MNVPVLPFDGFIHQYRTRAPVLVHYRYVHSMTKSGDSSARLGVRGPPTATPTLRAASSAAAEGLSDNSSTSSEPVESKY